MSRLAGRDILTSSFGMQQCKNSEDSQTSHISQENIVSLFLCMYFPFTINFWLTWQPRQKRMKYSTSHISQEHVVSPFCRFSVNVFPFVNNPIRLRGFESLFEQLLATLTVIIQLSLWLHRAFFIMWEQFSYRLHWIFGHHNVRRVNESINVDSVSAVHMVTIV